MMSDPAELSGHKVKQVNRADGLKLIMDDGSWVCYRVSARSRSCGFTLKPVRKRVWTPWQPQLATGSNNNVGENQKRKGTALSLTPQAGGGRDWHLTLRVGYYAVFTANGVVDYSKSAGNPANSTIRSRRCNSKTAGWNRKLKL